MNEEQDPKPGRRFLSKVVKFVTSPTTDWADLNKVGGRADTTESSAALKEMIERKRRNDFVRNREFDMLRKARRRQLAGGAAGGSAPTSYISNVESAHPHEPERTLEKIDQIEEQMARGWLDPDSPNAPATPAGAYDKTRPVDLADLPGDPVARHFDPTVVEPHLAALAHADAPHPTADTEPDVLAARSAAAPAPAPDPEPVQVSPEVEEVAIRFANGDAAGAEANLLELLADGSGLSEDAETWLTLFDLYRAAGEPDKFDGAAIAFAGRFGRSAPQWDGAAGVGSRPMPMTAPSTAPAPVRADAVAAHWTAPSVIGPQSIAALNASLARQAQPWRLDWRRVRTIDPTALPALLDVLQRWAGTPVRLRFLGGDQLLHVLAAQTPSEQRDIDPRWWAAHLAALRVINEPDEFELVALNYCVTYEMSPPPWEDPRCEWAPMADDGHTLPPPDADAPADGLHSELLASGAMPLQGGAAGTPDWAKLELEGELLGDATAPLQALAVTSRTRVIEFNCRQLRRVDFGAAGDLLNWAMQQQGQGRQVVFRHANRLVAAFFGVIGISDAARVLRRVD